MNVSEFRQYAARIEALYKAPFSGKDEKNAWYQEMLGISFDAANKALSQWLRESKFVPTLSELMHLALELEPPKQVEEGKHSDIAWMKPYIEEHDRQLLAKWGTWEAYREHLRDIGVPDPISGLA